MYTTMIKKPNILSFVSGKFIVALTRLLLLLENWCALFVDFLHIYTFAVQYLLD